MLSQGKAFKNKYSHLSDKVVDVNTGEVKIGVGEVVLRSNAIGSCIVVVVYNPEARTGGLAHIMLPGASRNKKVNTKYADDAILELLDKLLNLGIPKSKLTACVVGAGNVLKRENETLCMANINYVTGLLERFDIPVNAQSLGGVERRSVVLDVATGTVNYTIGDGAVKNLWQY